MMKNIILYSLLFAFWSVFSACEKPAVDPAPKGQYEKGIFVVNEGSFGNTSGTITYHDRSGTTIPRIFWKENQRDLGDVVQSLIFEDDKGYIVVNNSNKIEVVDANTFQEEAQITGLRLPRYCLPTSSTEAYVTEWGTDGLTGSLARLDLTTNTIAERYALSVGPERLLLKDKKLYITHIGGFATNDKVTVFDTQRRQVETMITVGDRPSGIVEDKSGLIWVACAGNVAYTTYPQIDTAKSTASQLVSIDPATNHIATLLDYGKGNPIGNLINNSPQNDLLIYSRGGQVWSYEIAAQQEQRLFSGSYYGLGYDPKTQNIYGAVSAGANPAPVNYYKLNGTSVGNFTAGQFANGFVFR